MSHTNGTQADTTTTERKPPTLADIVREKTDDGRRIIDFFLDVMEDRVDGAELCHRIDAAKTARKVRLRGRRQVHRQVPRRPLRALHPWTPQPGRPLLRR